jgi:regulator of replication initiation timing
MFAINQTTLAIITAITGVLATGMLCFFVIEMIIRVEENKKIKEPNRCDEKEAWENDNENFMAEIRRLNSEIDDYIESNRTLYAENKQLSSENKQLENELWKNQITIDELQTEIQKIQPETELLEENQRLEIICEKLSMKLFKLKKEKREKREKKEKKEKKASREYPDEVEDEM